MNNRIKRFMDYKSISSSELADTIGVQRSNVTHVLHGRNKPSFQFISKLLETYPEINAKWLIMGTGDMLESGQLKQQPQLFADEVKPKAIETQVEPENAMPKQEPANSANPITKSESETPSPTETKAIERIVVFYTDQTFKEYHPSK